MKKTILFLMMFIVSIINAQDKIYVHTATVDNISGHITYIDHPDLNGNPNAGIVYSHAWNPNETPGVYNNNIDGLWYDGSQWAIFNEDTSIPMVEGAKFFIYIASDPSQVITHESNAGNQGSFGANTTVIDNPLLNGLIPGPYAVKSNYWNPNGVYNNKNYGFYYDTTDNKRGLFTEDGTAIPTGAAFKILIDGTGAFHGTHEATAANSIGNYTIIDDPDLNGNPNAVFVFSHYWGVNGAGTEIDSDNVYGAWYNGTNWSIYSEDNSTPIPVGMAFDYFVVPQEILGNNDFISENNIVLFPNPATNQTTISSLHEISSIQISNVLGQKVQQLTGNEKSVQVNLENLNTGTYFVKIEAGDRTETLKLLKQ